MISQAHDATSLSCYAYIIALPARERHQTCGTIPPVLFTWFYLHLPTVQERFHFRAAFMPVLLYGKGRTQLKWVLTRFNRAQPFLDGQSFLPYFETLLFPIPLKYRPGQQIHKNPRSPYPCSYKCYNSSVSARGSCK